MVNIKKNIEKNPLQWIVQAVGVLVVIANVWITFKLAPVTQDILTLATRVVAIENRNTKVDPLVTDYIVTKTELVGIKEDIIEIRNDMKDIKRFLNVR